MKKSYLEKTIALAEAVINVFMSQYPNDDRPRKAIEAAKLYLSATKKEKRVAADNALYVGHAAGCAADKAYENNRAAFFAANIAAYAAYAAAYSAPQTAGYFHLAEQAVPGTREGNIK